MSGELRITLRGSIWRCDHLIYSRIKGNAFPCSIRILFENESVDVTRDRILLQFHSAANYTFMAQPLIDAIRDAGLTPCLFVRLICRKHGEMRIAITEASEHCPRCSEPAHYYILGRGGTRAAEPESSFRFESAAPGLFPIVLLATSSRPSLIRKIGVDLSLLIVRSARTLVVGSR